MCGIAGILGGQARAPELVRAMTAAMVHRGPDAAGFFDDTCVALGMRRLAIVDVAAGNQPQSNEAGTVWIVFNGEIYNHADLRAQLQKHGHVFRTASDTEVIVHGYEQWGIDGCLERLWGMFAFLLWDAARRELFAARDRLGIKPLYYMRANGQWRFASEVKALLACPDAPRAVNTDAIGLYLLHQYVPAPATFFAGVRKVLPGHYLKFDAAGTMTQRPFWRLSFDPSGTPPSFPDAAAEVRERVTEAVRLRLMSEVPLGCLLSGGLDSAVVATTMARLSNQPIRTFTVGFPEVPGIDERPYARLVAEHCHAAHTELEVSLDATALLDRAVYHLDEPLADAAALPTLAICEAAREHVTVLLTGEGSDELFAGYPRYALSRAADALQRIPPQARGTALQALGALVPEGRARNALGRLARDPGDALARNALWTGVFTPTDVA
ncbi:MAG: asparagine synthase (glutamine-hydrolyzing), partial [Candidatus Binatia bacterium]